MWSRCVREAWGWRWCRERIITSRLLYEQICFCKQVQIRTAHMWTEVWRSSDALLHVSSFITVTKCFCAFGAVRKFLLDNFSWLSVKTATEWRESCSNQHRRYRNARIQFRSGKNNHHVFTRGAECWKSIFAGFELTRMQRGKFSVYESNQWIIMCGLCREHRHTDGDRSCFLQVRLICQHEEKSSRVLSQLIHVNLREVCHRMLQSYQDPHLADTKETCPRLHVTRRFLSSVRAETR